MATQDEIVATADSLIAQWDGYARNFLDTLRDLTSRQFILDDYLPSGWTWSTNYSAFQDFISNTPYLPIYNWDPPIAPGSAPEATAAQITTVTIPDQTGITVVGNAPSLSNPSVAAVTFPENDLTPPSITFPDAPTLDVIAVPSAPVTSSPSLPTKPTLNIPTPPEISAISIPTLPTYAFPTFDKEFPTDKLLSPSYKFNWYEAEVSDAVLDKARSLIMDNMNGVGDIYGIPTDEEQDLVNQIIDRERRTAKAEAEAVIQRFAALGHAMPPGAMAQELLRIDDTISQRVSTAQREVFINRTNLRRSARELAINKGIESAGLLLAQQGFRLERALNASRFAAEFAITLYNAEVTRFNANLEAFNTYAASYATRVQAIVSQLEAYKAEIEATKISVDIEQVRTSIYETQVRSINAVVDLYRTEMEAAKISADIEQLKIQEYKNLVDAYVAQLRGQELRFNAYEAQIRGESVKVDLYGTQVDAHDTSVKAASARFDAEERRSSFSLEKDRLKIAKYQSEVEAYRSKIAAHDLAIREAESRYEQNVKSFEAEIERNRIQLAKYGAEIESYRAQLSEEVARTSIITADHGLRTQTYVTAVEGWKNYYQLGVLESQALREDIRARERVHVEVGRLELASAVEAAKVRFDAAKAGSDISGAVLSGATSILNTLISKEEAA